MISRKAGHEMPPYFRSRVGVIFREALILVAAVAVVAIGAGWVWYYLIGDLARWE